MNDHEYTQAVERQHADLLREMDDLDRRCGPFTPGEEALIVEWAYSFLDEEQPLVCAHALLASMGRF